MFKLLNINLLYLIMEDIFFYILTQRHIIELEYYKLKSDSSFRDLDINFIEEYYNNLKNKDNFILDDNDIKNLLDNYEEGTYGILNYYNKNNKNQLIKYIEDSNYEYYNKANTVNKLIKKSKFTDEGLEGSYGFLFLYEKTDNIKFLEKVYLLKNGDIDYINEDTDDNVITKIYEFGTKIILKEIIYENNFKNKVNRLEELYKLDKKFKKYINDNIKTENLKSFLNNFSYIKTMMKKIIDPVKQQLKLDNLIKFDFSNKLENIKISNSLDKPEYDNLINSYFDESLEEITDNILCLYDIKSEFKKYLYILFDILIRIYIDDYLKNRSFCLSKKLVEYLNFNTLLSEPDTCTTTLRRRYWSMLLETEDDKKILSSLLILIKQKTKSIDETLKYLDFLYSQIK